VSYLKLSENDVKKIEKFPINNELYVNGYFDTFSSIRVNYKNGSRLFL